MTPSTLARDAGPDRLLLLRAGWWTAITTVLGAVAGVVLAAKHGGGAFAVAVSGLASGTVAGVMTFAMTYGLAQGAGEGILAFLQPSGASCPPERQFSFQEALAAQGDVLAALASYEELLRAAPIDDVTLRLRAADLYASSKADPHRAAALYRGAQRIPSISAADHAFATNRLITLYLGPLNDSGRAMAELRRLADHHPGTELAAGARSALARLKRETLGVS
jgi:hypothetical protein